MTRKLSRTYFALAVCLFIVGCGGGKYSGDKRFPLSGKASFDGEPIDLGSISFIPTTDKGRISGGVINDGQYQVPEENGATAGKYRVELHWLKRTGKQLLDRESGENYDQRLEVLPDKFHKNSELSVEVPSPTNTYDFELKSK